MKSPNVDFWGFNNLKENVQKIFNVIFVISGVMASFWRVFIKFRWDGQKLTEVTDFGKKTSQIPDKNF